MSSDRVRRSFTPEEKLRIVQEGRRPEESVSGTCRRYAISTNQFYEWEKRARQGSHASLRPPKRVKRSEPSIAELQAEIHRLQGIIAEIAAENVEIKKRGWP